MTAQHVGTRMIPQMRTPNAGSDALSVTTAIDDRIGSVIVRGAARPDALDPLLAALDELFAAGVHGVVLDATAVTAWSRRGLEVAVLTATRARGRRIRFAVCGLPVEQRDVLAREWPGVGPDRFAFPDHEAARAAMLAPGD